MADGLTNNSSSNFTVTVDDDSPAECPFDGTALGERRRSGQPGLRARRGPHRFQARAIDGVGNEQAVPAEFTWTVDTRAPVTTIDSGPQGPTEERSATFAFSAGEPATFQCSLDCASSRRAAAHVTTGMSAVFTFTADEHATFDRRLDGSGGSTCSSGEERPPQATSQSGPEGTTEQTAARFEFSADAAATFGGALDAAAYAACDSPYTASFVNAGTHTCPQRERPLRRALRHGCSHARARAPRARSLGSCTAIPPGRTSAARRGVHDCAAARPQPSAASGRPASSCETRRRRPAAVRRPSR